MLGLWLKTPRTESPDIVMEAKLPSTSVLDGSSLVLFGAKVTQVDLLIPTDPLAEGFIKVHY